MLNARPGPAREKIQDPGLPDRAEQSRANQLNDLNGKFGSFTVAENDLNGKLGRM